MSKVEIKKPLCHFCHCHCGVLVHVEDGKAVKIEGDRESPLSKGYLCPKGLSALEHLYHPDRLKYPLKRAGERGEGKWQRITWDQAIDEIAAKLNELKAKYGPETLAVIEGTDRTGVQYATQAVMHSYGTPNYVSCGTVCWCNTQSINIATFGFFPMNFFPGPETKCLVVWGGNPSATAPAGWYGMKKSQRLKERQKLIVIDPRCIPAAKIADLHLQLRPGTDGALALGLINVFINEGIYDKEFVDNWTVGFDQLRERVAQYTPEKVAEITWVPKEKIIEAARMYATNKPGVFFWGLAMDQIGRNSTQTIRAMCILRAISGNLDVPGGENMGRTGDISKIRAAADMDIPWKLSPEQRQKQLGVDRFKLMAFPGWELLSESYKKVYGRPLATYPSLVASAVHAWDAMASGKPYPVKAAISAANNPLSAWANTRKIYKALKSLELFVVMDYWMHAPAMLADYVLPAADWMERPTVHPGGSGDVGNFYVFGERAVKPLYERRTDYEFWHGLAIKLGYEKDWPWQETDEKLYDYRLEPIGITFQEAVDRHGIFGPEEYKKYEKTGFATPSGKVEIYSSIFEKLGYDPLPSYEEPAESPVSTPEIAREYPLVYTNHRFLQAMHSEHRQIRSLRKAHPDPLLDIHPETANSLGISKGDWVYVETPRGRARFKANVTEDILPKVVSAEPCWWFPEEPAEEPFLYEAFKSNVNILTSDNYDDCDQICGGWYMRAFQCKVYKVPDYT